MHEKAPPEVFTLVLEELKELVGGGDGDVKANMIASSFRCDKPGFLISLLREIPELCVGAISVVGESDRRGVPQWQRERQRLERMVKERAAS